MSEVGLGTKLTEEEQGEVDEKADGIKATLKEVTVSTSVGGKVQIVQYQNSQDYHYSVSQKWDVQGIESEEDAWDFREDKIKELRDHLEEVAQREMDALIKQRDELRES